MRYLTVLLLVHLLSPLGNAQQLDDEAIAQLVSQLGADEFIARENAEQELLRLQERAKPALLEGLKSSDLEVRTRTRRLLAVVRRLEFRRRIDKFLNNETLDEPLPGWNAFKEGAGDTRETKLLFSQILKTDEDILWSIERGDDITTRLQFQIQTILQNRSTPPSDASVALTLLLAMQVPQQRFVSLSSNLYSMFRSAHVMQVVKKNKRIQGLFEFWMRDVLSQPKTEKSLMMYLVFEYELAQLGLEFGRKLIREKGVSHSTLDKAATCLARFGDRTDLPEILSLLDDKRIVNTWSRGQNKPIVRTQLRDRAMAMAIYMVDKDPKDFGMPFVIPTTKYVYQTYSCGFETDEQREAAHKKWKEYWDKHSEAILEEAEDKKKSQVEKGN